MKNSKITLLLWCIILLSITILACGGDSGGDSGGGGDIDDGPPAYNSVSLAIVGDGTSEKSPDKLEYEEGEQVTITATPGTYNGDSFFFQYREDITSTENPLQITVDRDIDLTAVFKEDRVVDFPDGYLGSVIRDELDIPSGDLYLQDVIFIDRIYNSYSSIGDLRGLEICELLSSLTITGSGYLEDITPLSGLTNLSHLDLYNNDISDITPLLNLINLETLDIGANYMVIDFDTPNGNGDTIMNLIGMGCEVDYTYGNTVIGTP